MITDDVTFYAKWLADVTQATISPASLTMSLAIGESGQITITPVEDMEEYTITVTNPDNAITFNSSDNTVTANSEGTASITIKGKSSNAQIVITINVAGPSEHTVTFESAGSPYDSVTVDNGGTVGDHMPPDPSESGYIFIGWFIDGDTTKPFDRDTVVNGDLTVVSELTSDTNVARIGYTYYPTLQEAFNNAPDNVETEVIILRDYTVTNSEGSTTSGRPQIENTKNIIINGGNHTLTCLRNNVIYNKGIARIKSGTFQCGYSGKGPIENEKTLYIDGGTIQNTNDRGAVYNNGGTVYINDGELISGATARSTINNVTNKSVIYMYGGTVRQTSASSNKGAVENISGGKIYIYGGTIESNSTSNNVGGVQNVSGGILEIGTLDTTPTHDPSTPVIRGKKYGVYSPVSYNFYDGILEGQTAATNDINNIVHEDGLSPIEDEVTISGTTYHTLYYGTIVDTNYRINLNANGGSISENYKDFTINTCITLDNLPTPTNGIYTFDGWYEDAETTTSPVTFPLTLPNTAGETTFYAKWVYNANPNVVAFDMTNDAMSVYYASVGTWLTDTSTFQTNMDNNFNDHSCLACNAPNYQSCPTPSAGATLCDQPLGYDTGLGATVNVYESDEVNKNKGSLVSYTTSDNGVIYNMIPGETYYWELASDPNVHGFVKAEGNRRNVYSSVRNLRDLGGLSATYTDSTGTHSGTLKYGILYRGAVINDSTGVTELSKLGIDEEFDLRGNTSGSHLSTYKYKSIVNYKFDDTSGDRQDFRDAITMAMQDVVAGKSIYFHCAIGTDRTGTLAYFLEGLLGVGQEDKLEDYELSYFYGLLNRTRFHDNLSGSSINPRFKTMADTYNTNQKIYDWYIDDPDNQASDIQLVKDFRNAMITSN